MHNAYEGLTYEEEVTVTELGRGIINYGQSPTKPRYLRGNSQVS